MLKQVPINAQLVPAIAELVFKGVLFDTYHWQQEMYDGSHETFEMLRRNDSVSVIGIIDNKLIIMDEFQPREGSHIRFPGGGSDEGESGLQAAKREMFEETGVNFKNWRLVNVRQPYNKIEWFICTYLAFESEGQLKPKLEERGEKASLELMDFESAKHRIMSDRSGYLHYDREFFEPFNSLTDLLNNPEFQGREVDR